MYSITLKELLENGFKSCDLSEMGLEYIIQITTCISEKMQFCNFVYNKFLLGLIYQDLGKESSEVIKYTVQHKASLMWPVIQFSWIMIGTQIAILIVHYSP